MQGFDSATRLRYTCTYGTYAESCGLERVPALEEKFGSICLIELVRMIRMCQSNENIQRPSKDHPKTIQNHPKPSKTFLINPCHAKNPFGTDRGHTSTVSGFRSQTLGPSAGESSRHIVCLWTFITAGHNPT